MGRLRMPPITEDARFDLIDAEDFRDFLQLYQLSEDRNWHGELKGPDIVAFALTGTYANTDAYAEIMWRLEAVGLLLYEADAGWSIPDYADWNSDDWAAKSKPKRAEQLGLDIPMSATTPSPLNPIQAERFGQIWGPYPTDRRGSKVECQREFRNLNPDDQETAQIADGIERDKLYNPDWQRGAIPQLRRYLHGRHWEASPPRPDGPEPRTNLVRFDRDLSRRDRESLEKQAAKQARRERLGL